MGSQSDKKRKFENRPKTKLFVKYISRLHAGVYFICMYMYVIMLVIWFEWSVMGFQKQLDSPAPVVSSIQFFFIIIWILLTL